MERYRKISLLLLTISSLVGLVRGARLIVDPTAYGIFYIFPEKMINDSLYYNYSVLGWILFLLIGVFGAITMYITIRKKRSYAYYIIMEGIFLSFLILTHMIYAGVTPLHLAILPLSIVVIVLGVIQTPREF